MFYYIGLEILAFPCNQFGSQEPGSNEEIQEFACTRFKAEYPIFDKVWKIRQSHYGQITCEWFFELFHIIVLGKGVLGALLQ